MSLRVLVADDQALVRSGLCMILESQPDIAVVGEAADGAEAVARATELGPDVVLMDVRMPNVNGIEATREITEATSARVLVLTTFDLDEYVYDALRAGASGFMLKDEPPDHLIAGIRTVAGGDALLAPRSRGASSRSSCGARHPHRSMAPALRTSQLASARSSSCSLAASQMTRSRSSSTSPARP